MDVLEIRNQPLSTLFADFFICKSCKIVDRDHNRMLVGQKCSVCGVPSEGGEVYFPVSVPSLMDLMQKFYHFKEEATQSSKIPSNQNESDYRLAVVIFFCSLGEVLLHHFLKKCMLKMSLQPRIWERLFDDNLSVRQRVEKLFPALTGVKWNKAVAMLNENVELDYIEASEFYQRASVARNKFLHEGSKWAIPDDMPEQCIRHIWPVMCLFVDLHKQIPGTINE